jgi:hypothetical protein
MILKGFETLSLWFIINCFIQGYGHSSVVEYMLSMCKVQGSVSSTTTMLKKKPYSSISSVSFMLLYSVFPLFSAPSPRKTGRLLIAVGYFG